MKICDETVRAAVDSGLGSVRMDAAQKQAILAQCRPTVEVARPARRMRPLRRALALAAAFALVLCLGGGVLAAAPELQQRLAMLSEETLRLLQPVNQTSEDEGVRMEVLAALSDGQAAAVYIALRDTAGQGRIGPDTEMYTADVSGAIFTQGEVVDYDEATGTAILRLTADGNQQLAGKKITVSTTSITSGHNWNDPVDLGYTMEQVRQLTGQAPVQYTVPTKAWSATGPEMERYCDLLDTGQIATLIGWSEPLALPGVDWATVNAAGVVDGQIHIQVNQLGGMGQVNRLGFSLKDGEGKEVPCTELEMELGQEHEMGTFRNYNDLVEYVLIPPEDADPAQLTLQLETETYDHLIEGQWATTFRLEDASESLVIPCDRDMNPWRVTRVQVSPIAVTATGSGEMTAESESAELRVFLTDGTEVPSSSASVTAGDEEIVYRCIFDKVIDLTQVAKVTLNGEELPLP